MFQPPEQVTPKSHLVPEVMQLFKVVKPVASKLQIQLVVVLVQVPMVVPPMLQYNKPPPQVVVEQLLNVKAQPLTCKPLPTPSVGVRLQL